jgi:hypothetical protein
MTVNNLIWVRLGSVKDVLVFSEIHHLFYGHPLANIFTSLRKHVATKKYNSGGGTG